MNFFEQARQKFNAKQFVSVKSLDYLKGAYIKKLNTKEVLAMAEVDETIEDDDKEGLRKIAVIIKEHLYDDKKEASFDNEEGEDFLTDMPIGDLMALFQELMDISGANAKVEELKKK